MNYGSSTLKQLSYLYNLQVLHTTDMQFNSVSIQSRMLPIKMFTGPFYLHLQGSPRTVSYMVMLKTAGTV
jgi:hypothetical protein